MTDEEHHPSLLLLQYKKMSQLLLWRVEDFFLSWTRDLIFYVREADATDSESFRVSTSNVGQWDQAEVVYLCEKNLAFFMKCNPYFEYRPTHDVVMLFTNQSIQRFKQCSFLFYGAFFTRL